VTAVATCQRHLDDWESDAYLFALSEPLEGHSEVIVSAVVPDGFTTSLDSMIDFFEQLFDLKVTPEGKVGDPEVLIFKVGPLDKDAGIHPAVLCDSDDRAIGIRGTLDHEQALAKYGYTTDWNGQK
jgi:hypothetical protein